MKTKPIVLIAATGLCLASFFSCNKIKDLVKADINLDKTNVEVTIPIIDATGQKTLGENNIYINIDSIINSENSKLGADNIKEVHITSCDLNLSNGDAENNFSAIESCAVEVKSNNDPTYTTIASIANNPDVEAQTLSLPVNSDLELKDYFLNANTFSYRISGNMRKTTNKELNLTLSVRYTITAGL